MQAIKFKKTCAYTFHYYRDNEFYPSEYKHVFQKDGVYDVDIKADHTDCIDVAVDEGMIFGLKKKDYSVVSYTNNA